MPFFTQTFRFRPLFTPFYPKIALQMDQILKQQK